MREWGTNKGGLFITPQGFKENELVCSARASLAFLAVGFLAACGKGTPITSGTQTPPPTPPPTVTAQYPIPTASSHPLGIALGSDGNNDTAPSAAEGVDFPVHVLAINAMGLHLLDWLQFDDLVAVCEEVNRWSFLCVIAPLRLRAGTGSPVNPIAIF